MCNLPGEHLTSIHSQKENDLIMGKAKKPQRCKVFFLHIVCTEYVQSLPGYSPDFPGRLELYRTEKPYTRPGLNVFNLTYASFLHFYPYDTCCSWSHSKSMLYMGLDRLPGDDGLTFKWRDETHFDFQNWEGSLDNILLSEIILFKPYY